MFIIFWIKDLHKVDKLIVENSRNKYSRRHTPSDGNISIMINGSNIHINAATTGGQ